MKRSSESSDEEVYDENQEKKKQLWPCDICSKQYKNKKTLHQHMQSHTSKRKCDLCDKSYVRSDVLRKHRQNVHGLYTENEANPTSFMCQLCNKTFNRKYHLTRHTALIHNRVTPRQHRAQFSCRHCDSGFQEYSQLFQHVMEQHPLNQQGGRKATTSRSLNVNEQIQIPIERNDTSWNDVQEVQEQKQEQQQEHQQEQQQQQQQQQQQDSRQNTDESALNNGVLNRNIYPRGSERYDVLTFFGNIREEVRSFLQSRVRSLGGIKFNLCVQVELQRDDEQDVAVVAPFFRSRTYAALSLDDVNEHVLNEAMQKMYASLEKYMREGSGWYVKKVLKLEIHTVIYKPLSGSAYIPLPKSLALSNSLLCIENIDNDMCFLYCLLAKMFPKSIQPEPAEQYRQHEHEINMIGITYPVTLADIRKVENQNPHISINVFTYDDEMIVPLRITNHRHRLCHANLLWLTNGEQSHYCLITDLNRFLSRTKTHRSQMYFCSYCLHGFRKETTLHEHEPHCSTHGAQRVELPIPGKTDILKFKDYEKTLKVPFTIYADFETLIEHIHSCAPNPESSSTTPTSKLTVCGFGYKVVCEDERYTKPTIIYRGPDAGTKMIECLLEEQEEIFEILSSIEPMHITEEHEALIENATHCCLCKKAFTVYDRMYSRIVRHHNHLTGEIIGAACNSCNLSCNQVKFIPVIFHNLKNFDAHVLCENLGQFKDYRLRCIAQNSERYVSFSLGNLRFIDSLQFLPTSLENLVDNLGHDGFQAFPHLLSEFDSHDEAQLLLRKGVYPYEYMDSMDRFDEEELPPKEKFYSTIKKEHISDSDYEHAQSVFQTFDMTSLGQYHDLYLKTDVVLLSDVFESFRTLCLKQYELDPCHFYTSPGLSWAACLKMTEVQLELLTDIDQVLMVEAGIRGGVSQISKRYGKANNAYLPDYDQTGATTYLQYLDANNLYGWAMVQQLPVGDFEFMESETLETFDVMSIPEIGETGYILEVSLEYPENLHDSHNCLPLAPVRRTISNAELSPYAQHLLRKLQGLSEDDPLPNRGKVEKLLTTLEDKEKYVLHYRNLKLYLSLGLKLKTIHRILRFKQAAWMKTYIELNTEMRKKATSTFQKNFYKLMNVSVFGKTMENVRLHKNIELVHTEDRLEKVSTKPTYKHSTIFNEDLVAVELYKAKVDLFKPIYCGMCILDLSKHLMYDFWYNYIKKKYKNSAILHMTDTDSVLFSCETKDIYEDMKSSMDYFDTSDYPKEHMLHSERNKKVLGKMKDETNGKPISEFVGLRSKMYSFTCDNKEEKRAKGIAKVTVKKDLKHEYYKNTLFDETSMVSSMSSLRSHKHKLFGETIQKTGLSAFDDKRFLLDAVKSYAYGHYKISGDTENNCDNVVEQMDQPTFSIVPAEDFLTEDFLTEYRVIDEQSFTFNGFEITPCIKL